MTSSPSPRAARPAELITEDGEPAFRKIEERVVAEAAKRAPAVIATGGGAFLSARARRALGERGLLCWLDATPTEIARRVRETVDGSERPLLAGDLETRLQELDDERRVAYSHADLWAPTQGLTPADVAERILRAWAGGASVLAGGDRRLERLGMHPARGRADRDRRHGRGPLPDLGRRGRARARARSAAPSSASKGPST